MKYVIATALVTPLILAHSAKADSLNNFSQAVGDSAEASARIVASGGQVAIGATALPLSMAGAGFEFAGGASSALSEELWAAANAPLAVDEDVVVAAPPPGLKELSEGEAS